MSLYWGQHVRSDEFAAASEGLGAVFQELWRERPLWGYGRPNTFRSTVVRDAKRHVEAQARGLLRVFCFHYIGLPLTLDSRVEPHFNPFNEYSPILPFHELLEDRTTSSRHFLSSSRLAQGISPREGPRWVFLCGGGCQGLQKARLCGLSLLRWEDQTGLSRTGGAQGSSLRLLPLLSYDRSRSPRLFPCTPRPSPRDYASSRVSQACTLVCLGRARAGRLFVPRPVFISIDSHRCRWPLMQPRPQPCPSSLSPGTGSPAPAEGEQTDPGCVSGSFFSTICHLHRGHWDKPIC